MESTYGLIGHPLGHSFSASYFNDKFKSQGLSQSKYFLFDLASLDNIKKLESEYPSLKGLNVTIPYKKEIIKHLDFVDEVAMEIGAVNCIAIEHSKWKGYNTDALAFKSSLENWLTEIKYEAIQSALIFGSGGSSLAVQWALKQMGIMYKVISRNKQGNQLNYEDLNRDIVQSYDLIINTTPLGMMPNTNQMVKLPLEAFQTTQLLYDLIYNPAKTVFLETGIKMGCRVKNGLEMLYRQAEISWNIWNQIKD